MSCCTSCSAVAHPKLSVMHLQETTWISNRTSRRTRRIRHTREQTFFLFVARWPKVASLLRPVTIAKSESRGVGFFSDFRLSKIVSGTIGNIKSDIGNLKFEILHEIISNI